MGIAKTTAYWVIGVFILVAKPAWATQHVVGGSQGWDQSTDYDTWAKSQTFKLGDTLVFKYTAGLHSVVELGSESEYSKCDTSNAANSFNGGNNIVKLDKVGTKYYACGTAGHCSSGMKLKVNVVAADSTSPTPSSSSSGSPSSSSSSSGSPSSSSSGSSSSSSTPSSTSTSGAFAHVGNKGICSASLVAFVSLLFCYF